MVRVILAGIIFGGLLAAVVYAGLSHYDHRQRKRFPKRRQTVMAADDHDDADWWKRGEQPLGEAW